MVKSMEYWDENRRLVRRYRRNRTTHADVATALHLSGACVEAKNYSALGWKHYRITFPASVPAGGFGEALWDSLDNHTYETAWELYHAAWKVFRKLPPADRVKAMSGRLWGERD